MSEEWRKYINPTSLGVAFSILSAYFIVLFHGAATGFRTGYLGYFGINIDNVNYEPNTAELMFEPVLAIRDIFIAIALLVLVLGVINLPQLFYRVVRRYKRSSKSQDPGEYIFPWSTIIGCILVVLLLLLFKVPLFNSVERGRAHAGQQAMFTMLVTDDEVTNEALVYQYDGIGLLKTYNQETKSFEDGYETIDIAGKQFEYIELIK